MKRFFLNRILFTAIFVVLEFMIILAMWRFLSVSFAWIESVLRLLSVVIVLFIVSYSRHLSVDIMWLLVIVIFPVAGTLLYIMLGANLLISPSTRKIVYEQERAKQYYISDEKVIEKGKQEDASDVFHYLRETQKYAMYYNQQFDYYKRGELGYPVMLEELKKVEKFIFLEYFIIEEGKMWDGIHQILIEKAKQGLDVRVMYDDMGSVGTLPSSYEKKLESAGIKCVRFNKVHPILSIIMNHRDHRKIMVIDGKVAFSGGVNLADEYINAYVKHGNWKDNIIRVKGNAVWSYTVLFLTNWNALRKTDEDYTIFKVEQNEECNDGYIIPYGVTPFGSDRVGQDVYLNMIHTAKKYLWIDTPYLIIDTDMVNGLILAAQRGVDVRIVTPGVPDKKIVWNITRSFYNTLINGGVKIYEYTPGFNHAKVFLSDDEKAVVGTINLDYRSLYLHFENGTYLYRSKAVQDIKEDFEESFSVSKNMQQNDVQFGFFKGMIINFIKVFASQM